MRQLGAQLVSGKGISELGPVHALAGAVALAEQAAAGLTEAKQRDAATALVLQGLGVLAQCVSGKVAAGVLRGLFLRRCAWAASAFPGELVTQDSMGNALRESAQ